jgi:RimJ/RimL family protein N-acetyltransferase
VIVELRPGDEAWVDTFLASHAASSMLLRSNLRRAGLRYEGRAFEGSWVGLLDGDDLVGVACHFWNGFLAVQAPTGAGDVAEGALHLSGRDLAGIVGPRAQVDAAIAAVGRGGPRDDSAEVLYELDLADLRVPEPLLDGSLRVRTAGSEDVAFLSGWRHDYKVETERREPGEALREASRGQVEQLVADGMMFVLEDAASRGAGVPARPLACSTFNATLPDCVQIGGVWTPPELRGRGYARSVVAGSLLRARGQGVARAILFTGAANVPARRAYEALGFREIGDYGIALW